VRVYETFTKARALDTMRELGKREKYPVTIATFPFRSSKEFKKFSSAAICTNDGEVHLNDGMLTR